MPQIELQNQEQQTIQVSSYNWKHLTKAGLVFAGTVGAFLGLKATGSFSLLSTWLWRIQQKTETTNALVTVTEQFTTQDIENYIGPNLVKFGNTIQLTNFEEIPVLKENQNHPRDLLQASSSNASSFNQPPILINNTLMANQLFPTILTSEHLAAIDPDGNDTLLVFTIADMQYGRFELVTNLGIAINNFTQQQITDGQIQFMYNAGNIAPFYRVSISDGLSATVSEIPAITFVGELFPEFQVNTYTRNSQTAPSIAAFSDDKFIVTWQSDGQDGNSWGVYGQLFNSNGSKSGEEFRVNSHISDQQKSTSVASLSNDGFIVTWTSGCDWCTCHGFDGGCNGISGQLFSNNGSKISGEFVVNTRVSDSQEHPAVTSMSNRKFVAVWDDWNRDGSRFGVYGQLFNNDGSRNGGGFRASTYATLDQASCFVANFADDRFIVTWQSNGQDGSGNGIYAQLFNSDGSLSGGEFRVNTYVTNSQNSSSVVTFSDGQFIVTWQSDGQDGSGYGIYAQLFNSDGSKSGGEFRMNTYTTNSQSGHSVTSLSDDQFIVMWHSDGQDDSGYGIYGQLFNNDTSKCGREFRVNAYTANSQSSPSVARFSDNRFIVVWQSDGQDGSGYGIYGRIKADKPNICPKLINHALDITQGKICSLDGNNFSAIDEDNDDEILKFIIEDLQYGQFTLTHNASMSLTSFTQQQITDNEIQFVHDKSENKPGFKISVNDGCLRTASIPAIVNFSLNELPQLINNQLIIDPVSQAIILIPEMLSATDLDDNDADLIFTISNTQHGQFEYVDNPGIAITSFTQQDIIDGKVQFIRDGSDYLPVYEVSVSDGTSATEPAPVTITFSGVNNVPQLITNELPLYQGQTVTVTQDMLYARDIENEPPDLLFIISDMQYGHFERTGNLGIAITRFTQQEINDGEILFIHDGSNTAPHFYVSVTDYTYTTIPELCNTQLLDVNDVPRFINNQLEVYQGQTVVITPEMLKAGDPDNNDADLIFTITDLQHGQFENISNPGVAITSFIQQDIINNQIQFVQDGSSNTPAYTVTVSDGELSTSSAAIVIGMERISLVKNRLIISDSLQAVLSEAFLKATHVTEDDKSLTFNATAIEHGRFALITDIAAPVTEFLQDKIVNRQVYFAHDGSGIAPAYNISVSDGIYATKPKAADVMFDTSVVVNDPPRLVTNRLAIQEGATFVLTPNNLKGTDIDSLDANLIFIASGITHGQFALTNNPRVAITSFTQQQIIEQRVCFVHDGDENAPSYNIQVSDGDQTTTPQAMTVTFTNVNDAPLLKNPIPDRLAENPGKAFSFTIADNTFSDAENDPLTLSAKMRTGDVYQQLPDWVEFDPSNSRFSGTPASLGNTRFSIFATDPHNATAQADFSVQVVKPERLSKGAIAGIVIALGATTSALLGFGIWKYKNHRDEIKRQKQHFLAARIRKHLNLNIQDFTSDRGREFITIVDNLIAKVEQRGILVKDMNNKELDALALQLAGIIEDKIIMQKTCLRANKIELETLNNITEVIANAVTQSGSRGSVAMQTFMGV